MPKRLLAGASAALLLVLAACSSAPQRSPTTATIPTRASAAAPTVHGIAEAWVSAETPAEELDSLATWTGEDGSTWLIATGKSSHRLVVYDAETGRELRTVGGEGSALGQFNRPNGIAVFGDHLFVVERDNHRVQVFSLPGFTPIGSFGDDVLRSPYGIWINETEPDELEAYITDSFMFG
jgi:3-phytase